MKKQYWSLLLRLLFAAAGVAYVAYSLTWSDHVSLPAGWQLPDGSVLVQKTEAKVVAGTADPVEQRVDLTVQIPQGAAVVTQVLPASVFAEDAASPVVKPGVLSTIRHARGWLLLLGLLIIGPIYPVQAFRWLILMRARGLDVTFAKALKLTMVGSFFNFCMPGTTGGDVLKAYYAAARSERRADSVMSVIFDRVAGLMGLVLLAGLAGLLMWQDPLARKVTTYIGLGCALVAVAAAIYFSRALRRALGLEWLSQRFAPDSLPARIDQAAVAYRDHKLAVATTIAISLPIHFALAGATALAGYALGMETPLGLLLTVIPVLFLAGSAPLTYQGLGVMEGLALAMLLHPPLALSNQIVGMLLMIRLYQVFYSLLGALYMLGGDIHMHPERIPVEPSAEQRMAPPAPASTPDKTPVASR